MVLLGAYYAFVCITAAKVFHLNGCFFAVIVTVRSYGHGWLCHTHLEHGTAESVTRQFSTELVCHALWHLWPFVPFVYGDGVARPEHSNWNGRQICLSYVKLSNSTQLRLIKDCALISGPQKRYKSNCPQQQQQQQQLRQLQQ